MKKGKRHKFEYAEPRPHYICLGSQNHGLKCRKESYLWADAIEELVWSEVVKVLKDPDIIVQSLVRRAHGEDVRAVAEEITRMEKELEKIQGEEDRAIRLYVSGKITDSHLDFQRKFITERLEHTQAELKNLRTQEQTEQKRQALAEDILVVCHS
jgi:hypothetical protein